MEWPARRRRVVSAEAERLRRRRREALRSVLPEEDVAALRVDEGCEGGRRAGRDVENVRLVCGPNPVRRRWQRDEPCPLRLRETGHVEDGPGGLGADVRDVTERHVPPDVGCRPEPCGLRGEGRRAGGIAVSRGRGRDVGDLPAGDADGDQPILRRGQAAEALAEDHCMPVVSAHLRVAQQFEVRDSSVGQTEQSLVRADPGQRGARGVAAQPGREVAAVLEERLRGAETAPGRRCAEAGDDPKLRRGRENGARARVEVGQRIIGLRHIPEAERDRRRQL